MEPSRALALKTLKNLSDFLATSVISLSSSKTAASTASSIDAQSTNTDSSNATLVVILADLHGLLTLLSKETTSLSLAFAPPQEHWDAVDAASKKLHELASNLQYGLSLLRRQQQLQRSDIQYATTTAEPLIAKQWRIGTLTVLECIKELAETSVNIYTTLGDKPIKSEQRKNILTNTSLVWKAVERTQTLPNTERDAFLTAWKSMIETFDDALEEVQELTRRETKGKGRAENQDDEGAEDADGGDKSEEEEDDDGDEDLDDFDFDDLDDDTPLSESELEIAQASFRYMKLVKALLRKIASITDEDMPFALMYEQGERIASTHDEVASALHPPQDNSETSREFTGYTKAVDALLQMISPAQRTDQSIAQSLADISLSDSQSSKPTATSSNAHQKWFDTCRTQLGLAGSALHKLLKAK